MDKYPPTEHEKLLRDSGLFTQVEPEWLAEYDQVTYVNVSRGVVFKISREHKTARFFYDDRGDTYHSSGWYDPEEIEKWILPVMKSDRAWREYVNLENGDITEVLDKL